MGALLLCCDLDRTLLPNGPQAESAGARDTFRRLVDREDVTLAFATGRGRALVEDAVAYYELPAPDYVIGDVGTTVYRVRHGQWHECADWRRLMTAEWAGIDHHGVARLLTAIDDLTPQESGRQNTFKLSYYAALDVDPDHLEHRVRRCLDGRDISWQTVFSIDEDGHTALFDVLPAGAGKLHALEFLYRRLGHAEDDVMFAGDSGNDLAVLASSIPAVLVANALPEVARQAVDAARRNGNASRLYLARGAFQGMNGCYAAGIVEGVAHFHPQLVTTGGAGAAT